MGQARAPPCCHGTRSANRNTNEDGLVRACLEALAQHSDLDTPRFTHGFARQGLFGAHLYGGEE